MKNLVLREQGDYTLIVIVGTDFEVKEYVVAWLYNSDSDRWSQGHYFSDLESAIQYMVSKNIKDSRVSLLKEMHNYVMHHIQYEEAYMQWVTNAVPDEPRQEDFDFIAEDNDLWKLSVNTFRRAVRRYEEE